MEIADSANSRHACRRGVTDSGDIAQLIIPAGIGLLGGIVGSLIAPWVHWGIERQRERLAARRLFISEARAAVESSGDRDVFRESAIYSRLRPHLSKETINAMEGLGATIQLSGRGAGANNFKPRMLDEIRKLEVEWELV